MFINIAFCLGSDRPSDLFFRPALLISMLTPLYLPSSSVSLSSVIIAVPMQVCLGKHSCTSSFPIALLNGTYFFSHSSKRKYAYPTATIIGIAPEVAVETI